MEIERGDIFSVGKSHLYVIDVFPEFEDCYGVMPASVHVVPAVDQPLSVDEEDEERYGIVLSGGNRSWDYAVLLPRLMNLMDQDELEKYERIGTDLHGLKGCYSMIYRRLRNETFTSMPTECDHDEYRDWPDDMDEMGRNIWYDPCHAGCGWITVGQEGAVVAKAIKSSCLPD
jgi:hypothetical protein